RSAASSALSTSVSPRHGETTATIRAQPRAAVFAGTNRTTRGGCMRGIQARGLGEWNEKNALTPAPASVLSTDAAQRVAGSRPAKNGNVRFRMAAFPLRIDPTFSE